MFLISGERDLMNKYVSDVSSISFICRSTVFALISERDLSVTDFCCWVLADTTHVLIGCV